MHQTLMECFLKFSKDHMNRSDESLECSQWNLDFDHIQKNLQKIQPYDFNQTISLIYIKAMFHKWLTLTSTDLMTVFTKTDLMHEIQNMYNSFRAPEIEDLENAVLNSFNKLLEQTIQKKAIGTRDLDVEKETLLDTIVAVCEELPDCHLDVFIKGGPIQTIKNYSTKLHIFPWLRDCLMTLEGAPDGIYLCYVRNSSVPEQSSEDDSEALPASPDGYFGYYIKSNGTLISVSERIDEAYPGEHSNRRNARFTEAHKYELFPYNHIFTYGNYDYKGYANSFTIHDQKSSFMDLGSAAYMPIIVAMLLLSRHYNDFDPSNHQQIYVDSLLPRNFVQAIDGSQALVPVSGSNLMTTANNLQIDMPLESILDGSFAHHLNHTPETSGRNYREYGCFTHGDDNIYVKLYGDGFKPDYDRMLYRTDYECITDGKKHLSEPAPEFVGSKIRMEIAAYWNIRMQLAEYIRDRMYEEYTTFGGIDAFEKWYWSHVTNMKDRIIDLCLQVSQMDMEQPSDTPVRHRFTIDGITIHSYENQEMQYFFNGNSEIFYPMNEHLGNSRCKCACSDYKASVFFVFNIGKDWKNIQKLFGDTVEIPKIIKGLGEYTHEMLSNHLLSATDACERIQTPFEDYESSINKRYWSKNQWREYYSRNNIPWQEINKLIPEDAPDRSSAIRSLNFGIGFSKRFWKKYVKDHTPKPSETKKGNIE